MRASADTQSANATVPSRVRPLPLIVHRREQRGPRNGPTERPVNSTHDKGATVTMTMSMTTTTREPLSSCQPYKRLLLSRFLTTGGSLCW